MAKEGQVSRGGKTGGRKVDGIRKVAGRKGREGEEACNSGYGCGKKWGMVLRLWEKEDELEERRVGGEIGKVNIRALT